MKKLFVFGVLVFLVSGCGRAPDDTSAAEGLWVGPTGDSRKVTGFVLDDGRYYFFYSTVADDNVNEGVVFGDSDANGGNFTSKNGIDLSTNGPGALNNAAIFGIFRDTKDLNVIITSFGSLGAVNLASDYDKDYEENPSLGVVLGNYTGTM